jgi:hypothetical protein
MGRAGRARILQSPGMTTSARSSVRPIGPVHSTIREGVMVGGLGALAVALWFLLVDGIAGRALHTPALLGAMVSRTPDPIAASEGPNRLMLAAIYTPIHFILFALFGVLVVSLMHRATKQPSLLMLALMLFAVFEVGFTGFVAMLGQSALGDLAWYQVAIGNLIAVIVMGWYVWRRHPDVPAIWSRRLDDNG